ncbi:MAG: thioredoxin family protein [Burkholderiaceae bacterium]
MQVATGWKAWLAAAITVAAGAAQAAGVAWLDAAGDADIERAFTQARAENKPLLLYWGAKWCPPCNQLKATLFNRQDFAERSRSFVAVNIDGDLPGAQKLGARFKVSGYPTMVLMNADGAEITRLPGEVDAPQVMQVLQLGLAGGRPVKAVLADARAGKPLVGNEWRVLAFYAWDTDESQLLPAAERPGVLAQLSRACPPSEADSATRLMLKALADSDDGKGVKPDDALRERVRGWLGDAALTRRQMDVVVNYAPEITRALAPDGGAPRKALAVAFERALKRLEADATLSRGDRQSALMARVELARIDAPKDERHPAIAASLLKEVREHSARADREITDGYERQAVVTAAAHMLAQAGLWKESDALLEANLAKSHSPYYLMSQLGGNARKLGRKSEALDWYEQAWVKSEGPATRLQWGSSYVNAMVELSPQDPARLEKTVSQLIREAAGDAGAFDGRSVRALRRVGDKLAAWNTDGRHDPVIVRLKSQLDAVCAKMPAADAQRAACEGILRKAIKTGAA